MSGCALYAIHDLSQGVGLTKIVTERGKDEMNMIWHYNKCDHSQLDAIVMKAMFEHEGTSIGNKLEVVPSLEGDEMWCVGSLNVGKIASIHVEQHATAEGGCAT